jgi:hypothetical protein
VDNWLALLGRVVKKALLYEAIKMKQKIGQNDLVDPTTVF